MEVSRGVISRNDIEIELMKSSKDPKEDSKIHDIENYGLIEEAKKDNHPKKSNNDYGLQI